MRKKEEDDILNAKVNRKRPCTVSDSIIQSCKEVKGMQTGVLPKRSLDELFDKIEKWTEEERR